MTIEHGALTHASRYNLAAVACLAVLSAAMWVAFFPLLADDAYIGARYVRQLYAGHGLVFNAGERINALTSPLHTLVLAAIQPLATDIVTAYRFGALLLTAGSLLVLAGKAYARFADRLVFLVLTLGSPLVAFWTVGGLETPLLLCLCSWLTWLALSTRAANESSRAVTIIVLSALATLTRYDSVLFVAPVAALCLWREWRNGRVLASAAIAALTILLWLAFTKMYYGDILPTSYYVKSPLNPDTGEIGRGLIYVASFFVLSLAVVGFAFRWRARRWGPMRMTPYAAALAMGLAVEAVYGVFAGTKHMMYAYRLFVPYLPSLVLLSLPALRRSAPPAGAPGPARGALTLALLGYQALFALVLYFLTENPNLSLLFRAQSVGNEIYEFSTLGAKYTGSFLAAVRASATDIDAHWRTLPYSKERAPRLDVMTGGTLPYLLPDAYVLEPLISYRHRCKPELYPFADYLQVVHKANESIQLPNAGSDAGPWERISAHSFAAQGLQKDPIDAVVEIWFRRNHSPPTLPTDINGPCVTVKPEPA